MANKKYNEFPAGSYDTSKIFLQADATSGALEKINLPTIPDSSLLVPYVAATANLNLGLFELQSPRILGGSGISSSLSLQGTSGVGSEASAGIKFLVGNNGATTAMTILHSGNIGIGNTPSPLARFEVNCDATRKGILFRGDITSPYTLTEWQMDNGNIVSYLTSAGRQKWNIHTGTSLQGSIAYETPGGLPGIIFREGPAEANRFNLYYQSATNFAFNFNALPDGGGLNINTSGNIGVGTTSASALIHLKAGTSLAGGAPIKLTAGTLLSIIEAGALEWDGTSLYISQAGVRKQIAYVP